MNEINFSDLCGFHDKQWTATDAADAHKYTLYGGSRGPGKSYWLRWYLVRFLFILAGRGLRGVSVALTCENYPSLKDRQISKISEEFPDWLGELRDTKERGLGFHFHDDYGGGSILLRNLDDPSKYQSAEFAAIAVDELTKNTERTFHVLRGSLRWPGVPDTRFIAATNPDANWVRDYWIEGRFPDEMASERDQFAFVAALPDDNPHLDEGYWKMLDTLPGALRQAWRYGDWYASVEGLVFDTFTSDNIVDMEPDPELPIELAIDDGYIDARATLFIQRTGTHILVFDELYQTKTLEEQTIDDIAGKCRNASWASGRDGRLPELAAVSHEAVALRSRLRQSGIFAENWMGNNRAGRGQSTRIEAIKLTRSLFCDGQGHRMLLIHRRCKNLIDEITMGYKYPEGRRGLNEKPADGNDHACEALEGWCWLRMAIQKPALL